MLQNEAGLPLTPDKTSEGNKRMGNGSIRSEIPWDGILVDDPDIRWTSSPACARSSRSSGTDGAEAIEHEACEILGVQSLRDYFRKPAGFFADHLKRYSKSRRQAPIYWPLSTPSGSYTLWIYYHRLTDQTLYTCVNDFVEPKLKQVAGEAARSAAEGHPDRHDEKELERADATWSWS